MQLLRVCGASLGRLGAVLLGVVVFLQGVEARHRHDVVAGIDEVDLTGDAGGKIRKKVECRVADLFDGDGAAQRRVG